ncbi:hypothetical protein FHL15_010877 [Xylaria flabelliformis]|uniref:Mid2 domain-containing protein n=1 Tax=Xylaria flabelliformis TaxID=2512241 RepID=A0A553HJX0_9PEZI|nr:hypothetical protein FHL15_010877 [Xylaria flabelliformis]
MKFAIILLASSSCTHAAWLRWSVNREAVRPAQETGRVTESNQIGWTPIPTPAPGVRSDGEVVLDMLKRQTSKTDWTNSETCGWFAGVSSSAVLCGDGFTCATNSDHAVACASGTISPFFTACLDYSAFQAGSCDNLDAATGCCQQATEPACGTYIWTGSPERFMYKCFEKASIISVLDVPQFVLDASLFSKTHTTPTPTITPSKTATNSKSGSASSPDKTGGSNPGSEGANPTSGSSTGTPATGSGADGSDGSNGSNGSNGSTSTAGSNNTPIIIGSVIGGLAGLLLLILLLLFCLRRKTKGKLGLGFTRNKKNKKEDNSSKAYHTTNVAAAAAKGRNSSGSEATTAMPVPMQQQREYHYHNQEQQHYHPQAQVQPQFQPQAVHLQQHQNQQPLPPPQYQGPSGGQPVSMSHTVNEGPTHVSQPSYPHDPSHAAMQTAMSTGSSSSGAPSRFVVGGILPIPYNSNEKQQNQQQPYYQQPPQGQPQFQQFQQPSLQQQQQQGIPSQLQPVNHIHVYYAPPAQPAEQGTSNPSSQFASPAPDAQMRGGVVPDALGLFMQPQHEQGHARGSSQDRSQTQQSSRGQEQDSIPAYYGHSRDVSAVSSASRRNRSPSPDVDAEWLAARGPGYRQSM